MKKNLEIEIKVPRGINGFNYYLIKMRKKWSRSGARLIIYLSPAHDHPFLENKKNKFCLDF